MGMSCMSAVHKTVGTYSVLDDRFSRDRLSPEGSFLGRSSTDGLSAGDLTCPLPDFHPASLTYGHWGLCMGVVTVPATAWSRRGATRDHLSYGLSVVMSARSIEHGRVLARLANVFVLRHGHVVCCLLCLILQLVVLWTAIELAIIFSARVPSGIALRIISTGCVASGIP
ncbi:hypothetical protein B0H21DRAFT_86022 [Amylocystis lapponica]|nr:hypothetical protein B0H21DRAFT_86022 [Amylocystis lapponica]